MSEKSVQQNREDLIRLQEKMQTFEVILLENVNGNIGDLKQAMIEIKSNMKVLELGFERHNAVQSSWLRHVSPIAGGFISGAFVSFITLVLSGGF